MARHVHANRLKGKIHSLNPKMELLIIYTVTHAVYNLYFHPLSHIPGPFLGRASLLWRIYHTTRGRSHRGIQRMHQKHGAVFRVSPNELSFASAGSWKSIYGFPAIGKPQLIKGEFYDIYGAGFKTGCIGSERDPKVHAQKKKNLTPAFSLKALNAQEPIIQRCIDEFVAKIGPLSLTNGLNVTKWYEMVSFDILGEMAFGESFGCVREEKHHFWIDLILEHLLEITLVDNLRRIKLLEILGRYLLPRLTVKIRKKHSGHSRAKVQRRLEGADNRQDFLTNITDKVRSGEVSLEEMTAHASTLIIAGGETVSTCMAATTYYLLKTPRALQKLQHEVRTAYTSYQAIDSSSALKLPYLQACINEGLRIHPPGSQGFPRISAGQEIDGIYVPAGTEVYTSAWTVTHDAAYFHEPEKFKPERWTDPDCADIKEASQPFSLGLRACVGRNFAYVQMSLLMAKIMFRYDLELINKELDWERASHCHIMWWKAPIVVRFTERSQA
ncbi:putative cytochrome P450 [Pseudovirgaria hyperparasitica]|uniref:Putative cytochrome P450 n=1 Tax=Pseudovirgaria hyperparasitica TaxID=470096 RepID=A0A6A6VT62_9PEZI|nr:putative cytochrome P450 [Pseudovirgaria hyperparasitica]KAF2753069.1 putative cytochrome P450 [Pseudovirgaria hyperparasitica]